MFFWPQGKSVLLEKRGKSRKEIVTFLLQHSKTLFTLADFNDFLFTRALMLYMLSFFLRCWQISICCCSEQETHRCLKIGRTYNIIALVLTWKIWQGSYLMIFLKTYLFVFLLAILNAMSSDKLSSIYITLYKGVF